jgi:hypothetical protein
MKTSRVLVLAVLLVPVVTMPGRAQYLAPMAARQLDTTESAFILPSTRPTSDAAAPADTLPAVRREGSPIGTIVGGVIGGVAGALIGVGIAEHSTRGCHGELCGLGEALLGFSLGESLGLAVGAHVGSGSRRPENLAVTSMTSVGILVGGALVAAALSPVGASAIMLPLTPALQLAAAVAIECR